MLLSIPMAAYIAGFVCNRLIGRRWGLYLEGEVLEGRGVWGVVNFQSHAVSPNAVSSRATTHLGGKDAHEMTIRARRLNNNTVAQRGHIRLDKQQHSRIVYYI